MLNDAFIRLRSLFRHRAVEAELSEELQFHIQRQVEKYVRSGLPRGEALRRARLEFGGLDSVRQECREARGVSLAYQLSQDTRYALRMFARNPGFTAAAVLTLALGIGANTAVFSVINAAMLRSLPVREPAQLVQVASPGERGGRAFGGESFPYPVFQALRRNNEAFTDLAAFDSWDIDEASPAEPGSGVNGAPMKAQLVSANFFSMLGVNAVLGRTFAADEEGPGHNVAVISYAAWQQRFAGDPGVLGKKLLIDRTPLTIIGVAPQHFTGVNPGKSFDLWVPVGILAQLTPDPYQLKDVNVNWLSMMGRVKPGLSIGQAAERLDALFQAERRSRDLSERSAQERRDFFSQRIVLLPAASGADYLRKDFSRPLFLLQGMVCLVLLIACANVANLLLARAGARQREIAVRMALGAKGWRLLRQLLTESLLLALAAASLGLALAYWGSRVLVALMSISLDVHPDPRVLAFTTLLALLTGAGSGIAPAIGAASRDHSSSLRAGTLHATTSRAGLRVGRCLVVAQVALSLVVVVAAALLARTLHNLETLDPGFAREGVLLFRLNPSKSGYKDQRLTQLYEELADRLAASPGVRSASFSNLTPISGGGWENDTWIEGYTGQPGENVNIHLNAVSSRFFAALGTPLIAGRSFGVQDDSGKVRVAIINHTMARRYFAGRNPLGQRIGRWRWIGRQEYEIVGISGDAKYESLRQDVPPTAYLYLPQLPPAGSVSFEVNSSLPPEQLVPEVRGVIQHMDARLAPADVKTLAEQVDRSLDTERLVSSVSDCFGALALALACIGLYGVVSYSVARRTSEIGLRMALGAENSHVFRMVVGQGLALALVGLAIGMVCALILARLLTNLSQMLYGVRSGDPLTMVCVSLVLAATAVAACSIPALRAMRIDPMTALRCE
jgi:predicted permease